MHFRFVCLTAWNPPCIVRALQVQVLGFCKDRQCLLTELALGSLQDAMFKPSSAAYQSFQKFVRGSQASLLSAMANATAAVAFLHASGCIHRDLKPDNFLWHEEHVVKLADFGLGKRVHAAAAATGTKGVGTPVYMAPEVVTGRYGAPADVFSLGLVLAQMASGVEILRAYDDEWHRTKLKALLAGVPEALGSAISRCWAIAHERPTAEELLATLRSLPLPLPLDAQVAIRAAMCMWPRRRDVHERRVRVSQIACFSPRIPPCQTRACLPRSRW